jgi:hypothetical protein
MLLHGRRSQVAGPLPVRRGRVAQGQGPPGDRSAFDSGGGAVQREQGRTRVPVRTSAEGSHSLLVPPIPGMEAYITTPRASVFNKHRPETPTRKGARVFGALPVARSCPAMCSTRVGPSLLTSSVEASFMRKSGD